MYLVMFTTLANSILYALQDLMYYWWALFQGCFTAIGSVVGIMSITSAIKKTGRTSILVFMLGIVILICAVVIPVDQGIELGQLAKAGGDVFHFKWICK